MVICIFIVREVSIGKFRIPNVRRTPANPLNSKLHPPLSLPAPRDMGTSGKEASNVTRKPVCSIEPPHKASPSNPRGGNVASPAGGRRKGARVPVAGFVSA